MKPEDIALLQMLLGARGDGISIQTKKAIMDLDREGQPTLQNLPQPQPQNIQRSPGFWQGPNGKPIRQDNGRPNISVEEAAARERARLAMEAALRRRMEQPQPFQK